MHIESYGKCPSCQRKLNRVKAGHVTVDVAPTIQWHGISYTCPSCNVILGVQMDPVALKNDIVNAVLEQFPR